MLYEISLVFTKDQDIRSIHQVLKGYTVLHHGSNPASGHENKALIFYADVAKDHIEKLAKTAKESSKAIAVDFAEIKTIGEDHFS